MIEQEIECSVEKAGLIDECVESAKSDLEKFNERIDIIETAICNIQGDSLIAEKLENNIRKNESQKNKRLDELNKYKTELASIKQDVKSIIDKNDNDRAVLTQLSESGEDISDSVLIYEKKSHEIMKLMDKIKSIESKIDSSLGDMSGKHESAFKNNYISDSAASDSSSLSNISRTNSKTGENWRIETTDNICYGKHSKITLAGTKIENNTEVKVSRDIYQYTELDPNLKVHGITNLERMKNGRAPYVLGSDGDYYKIELHHITGEEYTPQSEYFNNEQKYGSLAELPSITHEKKYKRLLHGLNQGGSFRVEKKEIKNNDVVIRRYKGRSKGNAHYNNFREEYWKLRAAQLSDN